MRHRLRMVLWMLVGSFCIYCSQSAVTGGTGGSGGSSGPVGDAVAADGACCTPPAREMTVLFDGLVMPTPISGSSSSCTIMTPVLDVSPYRTIVIHTPSCNFTTQFRNGKAGFVLGPASACGSSPTTELGRAMTLDPILGHDMRVNFAGGSRDAPDGSAYCPGSGPIPITIVGYKNP